MRTRPGGVDATVLIGPVRGRGSCPGRPAPPSIAQPWATPPRCPSWPRPGSSSPRSGVNWDDGTASFGRRAGRHPRRRQAGRADLHDVVALVRRLASHAPRRSRRHARSVRFRRAPTPSPGDPPRRVPPRRHEGATGPPSVSARPPRRTTSPASSRLAPGASPSGSGRGGALRPLNVGSLPAAAGLQGDHVRGPGLCHRARGETPDLAGREVTIHSLDLSSGTHRPGAAHRRRRGGLFRRHVRPSPCPRPRRAPEFRRLPRRPCADAVGPFRPWRRRPPRGHPHRGRGFPGWAPAPPPADRRRLDALPGSKLTAPSRRRPRSFVRPEPACRRPGDPPPARPDGRLVGDRQRCGTRLAPDKVFVSPAAAPAAATTGYAWGSSTGISG